LGVAELTMHSRASFLAAMALALPGLLAAQSAAVDTCRACHILLDERLGNPAKQFTEDIHGQRGLTCADCHGGDPRTEDMEKSMSRAAGYRGVPKRSEIPQLCARCHSDGARMRAYNPSLRTDQLAQYRTSIHGQRLAAGDARVAVCSDCHGIHNIRPASSPISSVHPTKIPETCGRCHADAAYMKPYKISTDQLKEYHASVHFEKLKAGDSAAPNCATCHGNHGAAPPGVASVERVCGTCHLFQQQLFDQSPHKSPWEKQGIAACLTCHSNHAVLPTSDAQLGTGDQSLCITCHQEGDPGRKAAAEMYAALTALDASLQRSKAILDRAERVGMEVSEARVTLASGHEQLIKARVDVHAMDVKRVQATSDNGSKLAANAFAAGEQALAEYTFRRKGLALSLVVIAVVVLSLWLLIREIERPKTAGENSTQVHGN
jgi:predicted CXXCH cytochrome family protein